MKESDLYEPIRKFLLQKFKERFGDCYLEDTHSGFSERIKKEIPQYREIIFSFLGKARPDITGHARRDNSLEFITTEVKAESISLDDVYQAKKYADLFQAKYAFLLSPKRVPTEIKRLHQRVYILRTTVGYERLILAQWDTMRDTVIDRFEKSPFE